MKSCFLRIQYVLAFKKGILPAMLVTQQADYWPKARRTIFGECGPHQVAAVLRTFGHEVGIDDLYTTPINRYFDVTMPWDPTILLARHGIKTRWPYWSKSVFAQNLKKTLAAGRPVLINILGIQKDPCYHWISAWGYDEQTDDFLCYDSQAETMRGKEGNVRYSSTQLLNALPWRGTLVVDVLGKK